MSWLDREWQYVNAAETAKPGYLKRKFDRLRRELKAAEEQRTKNAAEVQAKVAAIRKVGK